MNNFLAVLVLTATLLACTSDGGRDTSAEQDSPQPRADSRGGSGTGEWMVRPESFGPVRFGAPLSALSAAIDEEVRPRYEISETCDHVRPSALPPFTSLMVISDTVMRVNIDSAGIRTAEGAQVGDSEARVLELYRGRVTVEPHKYTGPEGHYLVVTSPGDTLHRIIFETDGERVTRYRAGRRPAVEYVEGCA